jgi:rubrerythrin
MSDSKQNLSIIDLLIRHEEEIGNLYKACAVKFPDSAGFWQTLVIEEQAHADVLRQLEKQLVTQKVFLNDRKFNVTGVQTAIDHVNRQKQMVEEGSLTLLQIMSIALDIEQAIIDRNFFEVFDTDSPSMKREFADLRTHTVEHVRRISTKLDTLRGQ